MNTDFKLACLVAFLLLSATAAANADAYTVNIDQVGGNVVLSGNGEIDTSDLTFEFPAFSPIALNPYGGFVSTGSGEADFYIGSSGFTPIPNGSIGPGIPTFVTDPSDTSGGYVTIQGDHIFVPHGYASGSSLTSSATYENSTLMAIGLTTGTYTASWDGGADTFTVIVGPGGLSPVPLPGTLQLLAGGLGALGLLRLKKRKSETSALAS